MHAILVVRLIKVDRGVLGHFHWSGMERQQAIKQALKNCGYIYTVKCDQNLIFLFLSCMTHLGFFGGMTV